MTEPQSEAARSARPLLAIALASFAILFFQIAITRVLSVVLWYHWAFLSISLAMLGLGAPGVWFALRPPGPRALPRALWLGALALPLSVAAILRWGNAFGPWSAVFCMLCLLLPMLLLGAAVCILLLQARGAAVARVYGADLLGAALAAVLVLPALHLLPTPLAACVLALLPLLAAWLCGAGARTVALAAAAVIGVAAWGEPLRVHRTKTYDEAQLREHLLYEKWTPTARLTFFDMVLGAPAGKGFGWGFGERAPKVEVEHYWMEQDGSAGTPVTRFSGDPGDMEELAWLLYDVTTAAYQVRPPKKVAVIGGGGGRDILSALVSGATHVDAVELNGHVVEAVSKRFGALSGDVYHAPGVHAHVSEGRSFLTRAYGGYDLIQISLIDSWAATAAGAFALSENNLYTVEAYRLYLSRLAADGVVSTSRWVLGENSVELFRLLFLNRAALRAAGVADPDRHTAVVRGGQVATVITSKRPLDDRDRERLQRTCAERGFQLLYPAPATDGPGFEVAQLLRDGPSVLEQHGFEMDPPTDDRPFFFQSFPVFGSFDVELARRFGNNALAVVSLRLLMIVVLAITVLLFFAPFVLRRYLPRAGAELWRGSAYFAAIGLGFMLVEVPWLQRFVLYVGHPAHAAAVVIGSLLLGAGVGASFAARLGLHRLQRGFLLVPVLLAALNLALPLLFEATLGQGLALRIAISVLVLLPVGLMLGQFFPLGMLRFGDGGKAWFWAVNGAFGVAASVCSLALAMAFGFGNVAWIGVACYVAAGALLRGRPA